MMKRIIITIFTIVFFLSHNFCQEKSHNLFKVDKIKSKPGWYIIHAHRNDSLFKICAEKTDQDLDLEIIKKGHYYNFVTGSDSNELGIVGEINFDSLLTVDINSANEVNHVKESKGYISLPNGTKVRVSKHCHHSIYFARNLIGLYYVPVTSPEKFWPSNKFLEIFLDPE